MGKGGKASKNNPESRTTINNTKLKLSNDCEKCTEKCNAGIKYIAKINSGKAGIGIACRK